MIYGTDYLYPELLSERFALQCRDCGATSTSDPADEDPISVRKVGMHDRRPALRVVCACGNSVTETF